MRNNQFDYSASGLLFDYTLKLMYQVVKSARFSFGRIRILVAAGWGKHLFLISTVLRIRDVYPISWNPDPDFYSCRIPDPTTATKGKGGGNFFVLHFFVATNITSLKTILFLNH
jgi:hypothetical protein